MTRMSCSWLDYQETPTISTSVKWRKIVRTPSKRKPRVWAGIWSHSRLSILSVTTASHTQRIIWSPPKSYRPLVRHIPKPNLISCKFLVASFMQVIRLIVGMSTCFLRISRNRRKNLHILKESQVTFFLSSPYLSSWWNRAAILVHFLPFVGVVLPYVRIIVIIAL